VIQGTADDTSINYYSGFVTIYSDVCTADISGNVGLDYEVLKRYLEAAVEFDAFLLDQQEVVAEKRRELLYRLLHSSFEKRLIVCKEIKVKRYQAFSKQNRVRAPD